MHSWSFSSLYFWMLNYNFIWIHPWRTRRLSTDSQQSHIPSCTNSSSAANYLLCRHDSVVVARRGMFQAHKPMISELGWCNIRRWLHLSHDFWQVTVLVKTSITPITMTTMTTWCQQVFALARSEPDTPVAWIANSRLHPCHKNPINGRFLFANFMWPTAEWYTRSRC